MMRSVQYFLSCIKLRGMILFGGIFIILSFAQKVSYAQIETGSFDFEGHHRNYMVYLPNNYPGTINFPLVIYLHSYGWTAQQGMNYTLLHQVADTSGFIVVYPSAINNWNSGIGEGAGWQTPDVDDVGFINALIDTLSNHYSINLERIYACGFSNGGFMSYKLACQLSHRIAAIASVGGVISSGTADNCNPQHTMPVLQIHGTADGIVSLLYGTTDWYSVDQTLSYWTYVNGCVQVNTVLLPDLDPTDGCTVKKITYSNCSDESNVIFYKVINGGHSWPGAAADYSWAGNKTNDINAGVEILNFFNNYELVTSIEPTPSSTPGEFCLFQNYPNPFNTETAILYQLPELLNVKLVIYNLLGQSIAILKDEEQPAGNYSVQWDGKDDTGKQFHSGVYLYRLETMEFSEVKKLTLQR